MAKPATRQELIDYCLRRLGAPVLEVNVDDDQIDDLVDDALQYFQERHFDGVERTFLKYKITADDISRGQGKGSDGVGIVIDLGDLSAARQFSNCSVKQEFQVILFCPCRPFIESSRGEIKDA